MKRIFTLFIAVAISLGNLCAQTKQGMIITCKDATVEAALEVVQKITYQDEMTMVVTYNNGTNDTQLAIDNIISVRFGDVPEIVAVEKLQTAKNLKAGVYTVDGKFVKSLKENTLSGTIGGLKSGMYVIVMDGKTIKVKKGE